MEKRFCDRCKEEITTNVKGVFRIQQALLNGDTQLSIGGRCPDNKDAENMGINWLSYHGEICLPCLKKLLGWLGALRKEKEQDKEILNTFEVMTKRLFKT